MNNVKASAFMQRIKSQKRKPVKKAPPVIGTPAEQHAANLKRTQELSAANKEREDRRIQKMREQDEREQQEKEECDRCKRKLASDMRQEREFDDILGEDEDDDVTQAAKRPQRRPSIAEAPSYVKNLEAPEHEGRQTLQLVRAAAPKCLSSLSIRQVKDLVDEKLDAAVLFCNGPTAGIQKLHEMAVHKDFPSPSSEEYADWMSWMSPSKWVDLVHLRVSGNKGGFQPITSTGNYNEVLVATDNTPLSDASKWPGVLGLDDKKIVLRMTRSDSFGNSSSGNPMYRSITLEAMVNEMSMTLHAAACGFGVPVHAAVSWPWELKPGQNMRKYGLILALDRADGDMISYQEALDSALLQAPVYDHVYKKKQEMAFTKIVESFSIKLMHRCHQMASAGFINFDIKPGNILVNWKEDDKLASPDVYIADYDSVYCRPVEDNVAGLNVRFFVNLLLLSMHVRAYSPEKFVEPYVRCVAPVLMQLWELMQRSIAGKAPSDFGEGAEWVNQIEIAFDQQNGSFNHRELRNIKSPGHALGAQLRMMAYEYLFDNEDKKVPPRRAVCWPGWKRYSASNFFETQKLRLVPQLLRFIVFYARAVPQTWQKLFDV